MDFAVPVLGLSSALDSILFQNSSVEILMRANLSLTSRLIRDK